MCSMLYWSGHCLRAAPSLSLPLLSVSYHFSYLCLLLALSVSVLCGRADSTTNNKEFS